MADSNPSGEDGLNPAVEISELLLPPTYAMPNVKELRSASLSSLRRAVDYLYVLYLPEVRGSRRRRRDRMDGIPFSPDLKLESGDQLPTRTEYIQAIRSDAFERAYSMQWLTSLTKVLSESDAQMDTDIEEDRDESRQNLIDRAASLLASCSGASATGTISRQFKFSSADSPHHAPPISIVLTDAPLINADYGTVGAQTWGGACVLSEMLVEEPGSFGLAISEKLPPQSTLRILELGSGTGLVALTISKLFMHLAASSLASSDPGTDHPMSSITKVEIVLTDFHPVVLENLRRNVEANIQEQESGRRLEVDVRVRRLDWQSVYLAGKEDSSAVNEGQDTTTDIDMGGPFDLIFGADIIYEAQHALWVRACLEKMLAPSPFAVFHLVIPLRSTHARESSTIEQTFSRASSAASNDVSSGHAIKLDTQLTQMKSSRNLAIISEENIICDALPDSGHSRTIYDGADEVVYAHYKIGWEGLPSV